MRIGKFLLLTLLILQLLPSCEESNGGKMPPTIQFKPDTFLVETDSLPDENFDFIHSTPDNSDRENWQKPRLVISKLGDLSEKVVADIGAGTGYFTFKIAEKARKVVAVDIDDRFLRFIEQKSKKAVNSGLLNIETRLTKAEDPNLKSEEVDIVIMVNTYIYIENRIEYFAKVKSGLKENGMLVVVDFKKEDMQIGPPTEERLAPQSVINELGEVGFESFETDANSLEFQYIIFAR